MYIKYSRLSLTRSPRDSLNYFEISILRHIRFAEFEETNKRNNPISQKKKKICNLTPDVRENYRENIENIVEKRRNCSLGAISPFLPFSTIFCYLLLEFHV